MQHKGPPRVAVNGTTRTVIILATDEAQGSQLERLPPPNFEVSSPHAGAVDSGSTRASIQ